jgi:BA14K-like protein
MAQAGGPLRKVLTRILATGALLGVYTLGTIGVTGGLLTAGVSPAMAQRGRGRGGNYYRGRGRGYGGAAVGAGIAAGIIGGAIIADQARRQAAEDDAVRYCMQRFRSYNPNTGTYISSSGEERPCP